MPLPLESTPGEIAAEIAAGPWGLTELQAAALRIRITALICAERAKRRLMRTQAANLAATFPGGGWIANQIRQLEP